MTKFKIERLLPLEIQNASPSRGSFHQPNRAIVTKKSREVARLLGVILREGLHCRKRKLAHQNSNTYYHAH
jgi:hypothetical protein